MENLRDKVNEFYNKMDDDTIEKKDHFCPMIKEMCLGNDCAFWCSDADDSRFIGDHPCSVNIIASYILYEKWKED